MPIPLQVKHTVPEFVMEPFQGTNWPCPSLSRSNTRSWSLLWNPSKVQPGHAHPSPGQTHRPGVCYRTLQKYNLAEPIPLQVKHTVLEFVMEPFQSTTWPSPSLSRSNTRSLSLLWNPSKVQPGQAHPSPGQTQVLEFVMEPFQGTTWPSPSLSKSNT